MPSLQNFQSLFSCGIITHFPVSIGIFILQIHSLHNQEKLLDNCIDEKCFRIIPNMYSKIKSYITQGNEFSDFFACEVGVKQGENVSPFCFHCIYMTFFFSYNNVRILNLIDNVSIENITTYLRILILLYADDILLISESANGLQNALNGFTLYYKQYKLKVSTNKTKIMVFSKGKFGIDSFFSV